MNESNEDKKMSDKPIIAILESLPSLYPDMQNFEIDAVNKAASKLRDYELTGMEPEEVARIKEDVVDYVIKRLEIQGDKIDQELDKVKELYNKKDSYNTLLLLRQRADIDIATRVIRKNVE